MARFADCGQGSYLVASRVPWRNGGDFAIMALVLPSWFKQRQCKAEEVGPNLYRLTGPNLREAFIRIEKVDGGWKAAMRLTAEGPDVLVSQEQLPTEYKAWSTSFAHYREDMSV